MRDLKIAVLTSYIRRGPDKIKAAVAKELEKLDPELLERLRNEWREKNQKRQRVSARR